MGLLGDIQHALAPNGPINNYIGQRMQDPLFTLGMGMMSAGQPFADPGRAIESAIGANLQHQQAQQQIALQNNVLQAYKDPRTRAILGLPPLQQPQQQPPQGLLPQQPQSGGLLSQLPGAPPTPSSGVKTTPYTPPNAQVAAPTTQQPQQPGTPQPDPWTIYQQGVQYSSSLVPQIAARGKAMMDYAKSQLQYDPRFITQQAVARSVLTQDQALVDQARASGDAEALHNAKTKLLTDSGRLKIANNNGAATLIGGDINSLGVSGVNPEQGYQYSNGRESAIPGAPGAQAAVAGARARGEALGSAAGKTIELTDNNPNSSTFGQKIPIPLDTYLGAREAGVAPTAGAASLGVSDLNPAQEGALRERGTQAAEYVTKLQESADAATDANYSLENMQAAMAQTPAPLGPGAEAREWAMKQFSALAQSVDPNFPLPSSLTTYQELDKNSGLLGMARARAMGSREAAQIVTMAISLNPNKTMTPAAFDWIANSMKAQNNYFIAKNQAIQRAEQLAPGTAQEQASTWTAKVKPLVWDLPLDPKLAATLAPRIGVTDIATALPLMSAPDVVHTFRNLPASMRAPILAKLPPETRNVLIAGAPQ